MELIIRLDKPFHYSSLKQKCTGNTNTMKIRVKIIALFVVTFFLGSCSNEAAVVQDSPPVVVQIQKTPEMIEFERSLTAFGQELKTDKARLEKKSERVEGARKYLAFYNQEVAKGASENDIVRQALMLHSKNVKELINQNTAVQ